MYDEKDDKQLLPVEDQYHDGFDEPDERSGGLGPIEKCVNGDWSTSGVPSDPKRRLVGVATEHVVRRWKEKRVIETHTTKPLPDIKLLNEAVPRTEWELGLNGAPRPPYEHAHILHLLNLDTAERTTFVSVTTGAAIAVSRLKDKVHWMRKMRGNNVLPQIELSWAPFPTQFGMRKRPDFKVVAWLDLSGGGLALPLTSAPKQLPPVAPKKVEEPSTAEEMNDIIPF